MQVSVSLGAPAPRAALEDVGVVQEPVEKSRHGGGVSEELSPVVDGTVGGQQCGGALVAAHDELEEVLGGGVRELAHAEVVDDEERHDGQISEVLLAGAVEGGVGDLLDEGVGLAVDDAVALVDGGAADGLGQVALAGSGRISDMMPIIFRRSRCTTGGIRSMANCCRCVATSVIATVNTFSAVFPITRSAYCRRGCLIRRAPSIRSALP
jgi:hypothetical protein